MTRKTPIKYSPHISSVILSFSLVVFLTSGTLFAQEPPQATEEVSKTSVPPPTAVIGKAPTESAESTEFTETIETNTETETQTKIALGTTHKGTLGVFRTEAAHAHKAQSLWLTVSGEYSYAQGLFFGGNKNERYGQHLTIGGAPVNNLDLWLRYSWVINYNTDFEPTTTKNIGDPEFGLKYAYSLTDSFAAALFLSAKIPTDPAGASLSPEYTIATAKVAATYRATQSFNIHFNLGYRYDHSGELFEAAELPIQRFAANASQSDSVLMSIATDVFWGAPQGGQIGPFLEVSGAVPTQAELEESHVRLSGGLKWKVFGDSDLMVTLGADAALLGTPDVTSKMAGIPPWEVFTFVSIPLEQLGQHTSERAEAASASCDSDGECDEGLRCIENRCVFVHIQQVAKEGAAPLGSFRLAGTIISEDTGEPIGGSTISFSSSKGSPLAVDFDSGKYVSWPIECGDGLIQLKAEAAGYNAEEKTVARAAKGEKLVVDFKLRPFGKAAVGVLRGVLKSRETGEVIKNAKIWIPRLNKKLKSDKNGKFSITVKAGQYSIKVSHRKYRTQEKLLKLTPGDTIILNLDMVPK